MSHPFKQFNRVWEAQELLDYAFSKASSKTASLPPTQPSLEKIKRKEIKRIENSSEILIEKLQIVIKSVPNLDLLPEFYRKLSHLLVNNDDLRQSLGRLNGTIPVVKRLFSEHRRKLGDQKTSRHLANVRVQFFGRVSSVIKKLTSTFIFLEECRLKLKQIPILNLTLPCVVVAGYPNVGKSTIVGQISSAKPTVSEYPFTTKSVFIGMYVDSMGSQYFQVIDTPGVLDRPMAKRNEIEKQAILALNTVATVVLFTFDPTKASGYDVENQIQLYKEIKDDFLLGTEIPIRIVINKIDFATEEEISTLLTALGKTKEDVTLTNARDGENCDIIVKDLLQYFKDTNYRR